MPRKIHSVSKDVKEQILHRMKNDSVPVVQAAIENGISPKTIYGWLGKDLEGQPTIGEVVKLKRDNQTLVSLVGELTVQLSAAQKKS